MIDSLESFDALQEWIKSVEDMTKNVGENTVSFSVSIPPPRTRLVIGGPNVLEITTPQPMPNAWIRFWHRFLLGWRWEAIEPEMDEIR